MFPRFHLCAGAVLIGLMVSTCPAADAPAAPDFQSEVQPLLKKYCVGCHNDADPGGELSLESFASLQKGGEHGRAFVPGQPESSRLVRVLTGKAEPKMPPEGEPAPTPEEIEVLRRWIAEGARGPDGIEPDRMALLTPPIPSHVEIEPVTGIAVSPDDSVLAVARFQTVHLYSVKSLSGDGKLPDQPLRSIGTYPGKVTAVHFCNDGRQLVTASGVTGLGGLAAIWDLETGDLVREFRGHLDILFDAEVSPDGKTLATCSYDHQIILWDIASGEPLRTLTGHNGAVYDVAFSPDGQFLVSASADDTCKVWRVSDGERMDTLGQPLKEQYCCSFSPDGRFIAAGGADNRIRVWRFVSRERPQINPLQYARFAHEGAIVDLAYSTDGSRLVSISEDRTLKVWQTSDYRETALIEVPAVASGLDLLEDAHALAGRMDGTLSLVALPRDQTKSQDHTTTVMSAPVAIPDADMASLGETEPNDTPEQANPVPVPTGITGTISGRTDGVADQDLFRFSARQGQEWVIEVTAARDKSPLDSFIDVLDLNGAPVPRVKLQAVRDSYFTFRGKNADQSGDFRLFNWEEMELNEYLYANGEVCRLWLYPRGPDSGFLVYPGQGKRWGYFDTTPLSHALGEPCYIVRPLPADAEPIPNGLPVFTLNYENDDESRRSLGSDSRLFFTAPADGDYIVRIRDVRGFEGDQYTYRLSIRPRQPDLRVKVHGGDLTVPRGGTKEFRVTVDRRDQFDGPVTVEIDGLPPGVHASTPLVIEEGQIEALAVLRADENAPDTTEENRASSQWHASALIRGQEVTHYGKAFGSVTIGEPAKIAIRIVGADGQSSEPDQPLKVSIVPGETIMLRVVVDRGETGGVIAFGNEGAGRNLPHGVFVDNIGLNGLLLLEGESEREFFLTAAPWVPEQSRLIHLNTPAAGGVASPPVLLQVLPKSAE